MRLAAIGLLCLSLNAFSSDEKSHTSTLSNVYTLADGSVILVPKNDVANCQNNYLHLAVNNNSLTEKGLENMLAVALTAGSAGNKVIMKYVVSGQNCYINRLSIQF